MERALLTVGNPTDKSSKPWIYLAVTWRGEGHERQGIRLNVMTKTRERAIELGRTHHRRLTAFKEGEHYKSVILEDWAYTNDEAELLRFECPQTEVVTSGDVVITERRQAGK